MLYSNYTQNRSKRVKVLCLYSLKRSRSVANKTLVFGMLKIYSKVYNCFANELLLVLKQFSKLNNSTIYSDY